MADTIEVIVENPSVFGLESRKGIHIKRHAEVQVVQERKRLIPGTIVVIEAHEGQAASLMGEQFFWACELITHLSKREHALAEMLSILRLQGVKIDSDAFWDRSARHGKMNGANHSLDPVLHWRAKACMGLPTEGLY